jgi:alkaline phosphatase D
MESGRRSFLKVVVVSAGAAVFPSAGLSGLARAAEFDPSEKILPGTDFFPQSVASGDPRPDGVILWTRVVDPELPSSDVGLRVLIATDHGFNRPVASADLRAAASNDHCVLVKVVGLQPRTRYFYRFLYRKGDVWRSARVGRTKTAPLAGDDAPVRFAVISCQDAIGRFYNTLAALLDQDLDLVIHVGDYIYETNGDPSIQNVGGARGFQFDDLAGAIQLGSGQNTFYAAASLDNYRQIYRFYRSDALLQRVHERFAFANIWDDHEYSDDCWGATGTYFNGRRDEFNEARRRNAERAFFEYTPIDADLLPGGQIDPSSTPTYPVSRIYRDLRYGANLHLIATDYRTYRSDHLIPEDAFPGTVAVDRAALTALLAQQGIDYETVKAGFSPYLDIDQPPFSSYRPLLIGVLTQAYLQQGIPPAEAQSRAVAAITGKLDVQVINAFIAAFNAAVPPEQRVPPIAASVILTLDRGISFAILGKTSLFSSLGSRYFVVKPTFDLYAAYRFFQPGGSGTQNPFGRAQETWLRSALENSTAKWKLLASSTSLTSMVLDLTGQLPGLPPEVNEILGRLPAQLRTRFYLNVDQWDGSPTYRAGLMQFLRTVGNCVVVSGDIHAAFATQHAENVYELTSPAVSSFTLKDGVARAIANDPGLSAIPGLLTLVQHLDALLAAANHQISHVNTAVNGVVVAEAKRDKLKATYYQLPAADVLTPRYDDPSLGDSFIVRSVQIADSTHAIRAAESVTA